MITSIGEIRFDWHPDLFWITDICKAKSVFLSRQWSRHSIKGQLQFKAVLRFGREFMPAANTRLMYSFVSDLNRTVGRPVVITAGMDS